MPPAPLTRDDLDFVADLARRAGEILRRHFRTGLPVLTKVGDEPVTAADFESSALLVEELRRRYPDDAILSEEAPDDGERFRRERTWMIDPMDGTQDFVRGEEGFAVMIGLCDRGAPVLGVVHQPTTGLTYAALRGAGAFQDGQPIGVSAVAGLAEARLVISRSHKSKLLRAVRDALQVADELPLGSVGLKVGLVACGARDLYVNSSGRSKRWDVCGPQAILEEAGGRLTDVHGRPIRYGDADLTNHDGLLATNGPLHAPALARLAPLFPTRRA